MSKGVMRAMRSSRRYVSKGESWENGNGDCMDKDSAEYKRAQYLKEANLIRFKVTFGIVFFMIFVSTLSTAIKNDAGMESVLTIIGILAFIALGIYYNVWRFNNDNRKW